MMPERMSKIFQLLIHLDFSVSGARSRQFYLSCIMPDKASDKAHDRKRISGMYKIHLPLPFLEGVARGDVRSVRV